MIAPTTYFPFDDGDKKIVTLSPYSAAMDFDVTNINRNHFLSITYISRQKEQRPWDQRNDPIMVGDLPLKQWAYLRSVLDAETSSSTDNVHLRMLRGMFNPQKAERLEHLQILLHIEGQEKRARLLLMDIPVPAGGIIVMGMSSSPSTKKFELIGSSSPE